MNLVNLSGYSSDSSECVEFGVCQFGEPGESSNYCFVFLVILLISLLLVRGSTRPQSFGIHPLLSMPM